MEDDLLKPETGQAAASFSNGANHHNEIIIHQLNNHHVLGVQSPSTAAATSIIVQAVDPHTAFSSTAKLKSLLPKSLTISKSPLASADKVIASSADNRNLLNITEVTDSDILNSVLENPQLQTGSSPHISESLTDGLDSCVGNESHLHMNDASLLSTDTKIESAFIETQEGTLNVAADEAVKGESHDGNEAEVVKKTMVEAFVKMVVCRKVTVQTVHAKTGEVLNTEVNTASFYYILNV